MGHWPGLRGSWRLVGLQAPGAVQGTAGVAGQLGSDRRTVFTLRPSACGRSTFIGLRLADVGGGAADEAGFRAVPGCGARNAAAASSSERSPGVAAPRALQGLGGGASRGVGGGACTVAAIRGAAPHPERALPRASAARPGRSSPPVGTVVERSVGPDGGNVGGGSGDGGGARFVGGPLVNRAFSAGGPTGCEGLLCGDEGRGG